MDGPLARFAIAEVVAHLEWSRGNIHEIAMTIVHDFGRRVGGIYKAANKQPMTNIFLLFPSRQESALS